MTTLATVPAQRSRLRRMQYEPEPGSDAAPPPLRIVPVPVEHETGDIDEDVRRQVTRVLRLAMEVLDGRRPATQLARHLTPRTLRYWRTAAAQRRARTPARIGSPITCLPCPGVVELAVTCAMDGRFRALAARFEQVGPTARWQCTELRLG